MLSVTIWSIGNYLSNTTRPTTNRPIRSHFVSISPVPHLQSATNMFCISTCSKTMQWNIRRRKTRSERLRETSCCDEWRYGDVVIADLAIVFSETSGILISHFYERVFTLPSHFMRESHPSMATCAPYAPLKKRRHSAMKSPPFIRAWHCAPRQNMAVIPGFPISALFEKQFYPISALFRIPSGTVPTARLHQTPIPTNLQINGKTSRGDPAGLRNGGQARSAAPFSSITPMPSPW